METNTQKRGKKDNELSSVQVIVDNYEAAKRGEETDFNINVGFGKIAFGKSYTIKTGDGKLSVTESGMGKVVKIAGTSKDGVKISAVIVCMTIQKMDNGYLKEE